MVSNHSEEMPDGVPEQPKNEEGAYPLTEEERQRLLLDRVSLEALLAADEMENAPGPAPQNGLLSEADLAAIEQKSAQLSDQTGAPAADTSQFFDAAALDSLLGDDTILGPGAETEAQQDADAPQAVYGVDPAVAGESETTLDQSALDALLSVAATDPDGAPADAVPGEAPDMLQPPGLEVPLTDGDLDAPIIQADEAALTAEALEAELEATGTVETAPAEETAAAGEPAEPALSPEMLSLLTAAADAAQPPAPGHTAEPATPPQAETSAVAMDVSAVLGKALEQHRKQHGDQPEAPEAAPVEEKPVEPAVRRPRPGLLKLLITMAAATVTALSVFTYLFTHQERSPDEASLTAAPSDLTGALAEAGRLAASGSRDAARELLRQSLAVSGDTAKPDELADAQHLLAKVSFERMGKDPAPEDVRAAMDDVNAFLDMHPRDARVVDGLRWKAELLKLQDAPISAAALYTEAVERATGHPQVDAILMEAAQTALDAGRAPDAVAWLERLLAEYPGSPAARGGKLLLADAYARAGRADDAMKLLAALAASAAGSRDGAEAAARLARTKTDTGKPDEAIRLLEQQASAATTVEGNDLVYLALAQSYRAAGRLADARTTLNDVLNFFPASELTPAVYVELCGVLGDLGQASQAMMTARQAVKLFPKDPLALNNLAAMLEKAGQFAEAAPARVAAFESGGKPSDLLMAARGFSSAGAADKAIEQYRRLIAEAPASPEAMEASIELSSALYDQGQATEAVERLENLAMATPPGPRQLPVLIALGRLYGQIGINERAIEVYKKVASQSVEPSVQTLAAVSLMSNGAWDDGIALARQVDVARLDAKTACGLLAKLGEGLLMKNPRDGAEVLAKAYSDYPDQRTGELESMLLKAWLALGNLEGADGVVASLESSVKAGNDNHVARLVQAAIQCGDAAFDRGDYARAAALYGKVTQLAKPEVPQETAAAPEEKAGPETPAPENTKQEKTEMAPETAWATYQQANSLMRLANYAESARLFEEVAASTAPYAEDAKMKAAAVKVQQRAAPVSEEVEGLVKEGADVAAPKVG